MIRIDRLRNEILATATLLALLALPAAAQAAEPWMLQLTFESSPEGFEVIDTVVTDCEGNDMKTAGSGLSAKIVDERSGQVLGDYSLRDPRIVNVEPPDGGKWIHELLFPVDSKLMLGQGYHVVSLPLPEGEPPLPLRILIHDDAGNTLVDAVAKSEHQVPGDVLGCSRPDPEPDPDIGPAPGSGPAPGVPPRS